MSRFHSERRTEKFCLCATTCGSSLEFDGVVTAVVVGIVGVVVKVDKRHHIRRQDMRVKGHL